MNPSDDTIAAIATPYGQGAISLIRVSGPEAGEILGKCFQPAGKFHRTSPLEQPRRACFGVLVNGEGEKIDDVLATFFPGPNSYTGEDLAEIGCHGGVLVTRLVLYALLAAGARSAGPGEFSQRAFLNGKMDLTQAEAVMDIISAQTELSLKAAGEQLSGRLGKRLLELRQQLISVVAHVEAFIDFPEEDIDPETGDGLRRRVREIAQEVDGLLQTADQGRILREGVRTVICGAPNVGKSSLLNVLSGFDRAIVSETAGTTRDTIEEVINFGGIALRLVDTAGARASADAIEREGITRAQQQVDQAELILEVVDASAPAEASALGGLRIPESAKRVRLLNKADLPRHSDWEGEEGVAFSCTRGLGLEDLQARVHELLETGGSEWTTNLIAINARHQHCLAQAHDYLAAGEAKLGEGEMPEFVAQELRLSLDALGEVIGKTDVEEILGEIFSTFCIGK